MLPVKITDYVLIKLMNSHSSQEPLVVLPDRYSAFKSVWCLRPLLFFNEPSKTVQIKVSQYPAILLKKFLFLIIQNLTE